MRFPFLRIAFAAALFLLLGLVSEARAQAFWTDFAAQQCAHIPGESPFCVRISTGICQGNFGSVFERIDACQNTPDSDGHAAHNVA